MLIWLSASAAQRSFITISTQTFGLAFSNKMARIIFGPRPQELRCAWPWYEVGNRWIAVYEQVVEKLIAGDTGLKGAD